MKKYIPFHFHFDIDERHMGVLYITGNARDPLIPNCLPYDPSRYMHRHRGKGK